MSRDKSIKVVLPGDELNINDFGDGELKIGPGLKILHGDRIISDRCGIVRSVEPTSQSNTNSKIDSSSGWLDYRQKRYAPVMNDLILGQIVQKSAETYKVDFGWADLANLAALNFEGATKRNKPNIRIGDLVYGRICQTVEPEITCIGKTEAGARCLGSLPDGGFILRRNLNIVRKLLDVKRFPLLLELGKEVPFEICLGTNGWIWVKAHNVKDLLLIIKAVEMSDFMTADVISSTIKTLTDERRGLK